MRVQKRRLRLLILAAFLAGIALICIHLVNGATFSFSNKDLYKIEIRNGTNGTSYVLEDEEALALSNKMLDVDATVAGLSEWSSGYRYKIEIFTKSGSDEIIIKSEKSFIYGNFKYKTNKDMVELLEDEIKSIKGKSPL